METTFNYARISPLWWKLLKKQISNSVWSEQHPNAGQNLQHLSLPWCHYFNFFVFLSLVICSLSVSGCLYLSFCFVWVSVSLFALCSCLSGDICIMSLYVFACGYGCSCKFSCLCFRLSLSLSFFLSMSVLLCFLPCLSYFVSLCNWIYICIGLSVCLSLGFSSLFLSLSVVHLAYLSSSLCLSLFLCLSVILCLQSRWSMRSFKNQELLNALALLGGTMIFTIKKFALCFTTMVIPENRAWWKHLLINPELASASLCLCMYETDAWWTGPLACLVCPLFWLR